MSKNNFTIRELTQSEYSKKHARVRVKSLLAYIGIIIPLVLIISSTNAVSTYRETAVDEVTISLDWREDGTVKNLDLNDYEFETPWECERANVRCTDHLEVVLKLKKTWDIITVHPLDSYMLSPEDFSVYYPDLEEEVYKGSSPDKVMLLQRNLYDRGLLDVLPTGRFAAKTEYGLLRFQQIKGLDKCSNYPAYADMETVEALNKMKKRMKDPDYLVSTSPPPLDIHRLCAPTKKRAQELKNFIDAANQGKVKQKVEPISDSQKAVPIRIPGAEDRNVDESLQLEGYVRLFE